MTSDRSGRETELTRTTPVTTPTASSMGSEMRFSISFGAAPTYSVRTVRVGYVMSGSRLMGSREKAMVPKSNIAVISMMIVTGLPMEKPMIFINALPCYLSFQCSSPIRLWIISTRAFLASSMVGVSRRAEA